MNVAYKYDVFISHASEDKDSFVRHLASKLHDSGLKVWYDEFTLDIGDSLSGSIDKGLVQSHFGLVILSNAFISKAWPEYELRGLLARQIGNEKVILPIWHKLDRLTLLKYSPTLADIKALNTEDGIDTITLNVIRITRPDIFRAILVQHKFRQIRMDGEKVRVPLSELKQGPRRRVRLTDGQMRRIRIASELLAGVDNSSIERTYDALLRDIPVEDEIQTWEQTALVVHLYRKQTKCSLEVAQRVYGIMLIFDADRMIKLLHDDVERAQEERKTGIDIMLLAQIIHETTQHPTLDNEDSYR